MVVKNTSATKLDDIPGSLPNGKVDEDVDHATVAETAIEWLNNLQEEHLAANIIWRDILSFTDTYRTFYSIPTVFGTLQKLSNVTHRSVFELTGSEPRLEHGGSSSWLDIDHKFSVKHGGLTGNCAGVVSLTQESSGQWKIWMLRTWLESYDSHGHPDEPLSGGPHTNGGSTNGNSDHVYDVIIAGGGQGGLGAAGRSQALGVDYILFDERPSIGDSWGHRYDSLKWHTIREYGNLPFGRTFSPEADNLLPKDQIAAGYKKWAQQHDINAQEGTRVNNASWDASLELWTVRTSGTLGDQQWRSKNLVLSIGPGHQKPLSPIWATEDKIKASGFRGTIMHSIKYNNSKSFAGKRGIVVGTANTAHDVAEDMANLGMSTTMLQRNPTFIFPGEWLVRAHSTEYHMHKLTATSDREQATVPNKIQREIVNNAIWGLIKNNPKRFDDLENAGFKVDRYADLYNNLYNRFGGHYVDIGSCARIVSGEIKVKTEPVKSLTESGILFEDGSELEADLIVLCTGYNHDFRSDAAEIIGRDIAEQMDDFFGFDKEGELRGYSRLAGHPHLFYHGAEARLARFYSRFLALQLQKMKLGEKLQPYMEGK